MLWYISVAKQDSRMSDAGDDIPVETAEVEVTTEAPKGKLSVEDALQVRGSHLSRRHSVIYTTYRRVASLEERPRP